MSDRMLIILLKADSFIDITAFVDVEELVTLMMQCLEKLVVRAHGFAPATLPVRYLLEPLSFKDPHDDQRFNEILACFIPCRFDFDVRVDLSCCLRAWLLSLACFVEFVVEDWWTSRLKT